MRLCRVLLVLLSVFAVAVVSLPTARTGVVRADEDEHEERDADEAVKAGAKLQLPSRERDRHQPRLASPWLTHLSPLLGLSTARRPARQRVHLHPSSHFCVRLLI